jgi:hypothetical protein
MRYYKLHLEMISPFSKSRFSLKTVKENMILEDHKGQKAKMNIRRFQLSKKTQCPINTYEGASILIIRKCKLNCDHTSKHTKQSFNKKATGKKQQQ